MFIFIGLLVGLVFGYTSHIKQPLKQRFIGMAKGASVVSAANWVFYNLGLYWWASVLLGAVVYALFLMATQELLTPSRSRRKKTGSTTPPPTNA